MALTLSVCAAVVAGAVSWWVQRDDTEASYGAQATASASPSAVVRPSELYSNDGGTLIARFDTDPSDACLRIPENDWGSFCSYFVAWWLDQPAFGSTPKERSDRLRGGGYRIVSSLDVSLQAAAKRHVEEQLPTGDARALSVVSVQPGTGWVEAMATNRNFRPAAPAPSPSAASSGRRAPDAEYPDTTQPLAAGGATFTGEPAGATFMMFVLAAALDKGMPLSYPIDTKPRYESRYVIAPGAPVACDGNHWCPSNVGDPAYRSGRRTMWDALGHSVVTYFVPLEERVGVQNVVTLAHLLGISFSSQADAVYARDATNWGSFTLGLSETTPLELANAYATLAADGTHCDPLPVRQVTDVDGKAVAAVGPKCGQVLRPEVARAAMDAGRCPVGDRSAFGDRCGAGTVPAAAVRATVGRPVSGQVGADVGGSDASTAMVVASPQLATAAIAARGGCLSCRFGTSEVGKVVNAVAATQRDGLASLPFRDFTAPPRALALGG
ncbi:hypothetical protein Raf01_54300 [Rugosimonospora africana]|uniref:Penicillin-binding protein transpeptidase domain-containing protein n=1 Tax=Rugosimonospora africana TaxID=556532 RepID=A0A8J3QWU4_9ACTN|nr:hypothetical protein Raf01_54300 [Rugosimonospora africana]